MARFRIGLLELRRKIFPPEGSLTARGPSPDCPWLVYMQVSRPVSCYQPYFPPSGRIAAALFS